MAVGALVPSLFVRDFAMGHIAGGVASLVSHRSSAFFRVMRLIDFDILILIFYILDPWFPATISSSISYTLTADLGQVDGDLTGRQFALLILPLHGPNREHCLQQFIYCSASSSCHDHMLLTGCCIATDLC
jgi:hypothetical protein